MRGYAELHAIAKNGILPVFELTRSRRSKKNPHGDIGRRLESIGEATDSRPFILDLTTEDSLQNKEIVELLSHSTNGFENWVAFIKKYKDLGLDIIPAIHYNPDEVSEVKKEIRSLERLSPILAFRVGIEDPVLDYLKVIADGFDSKNLILIVDAGFVDENTLDSKIRKIKSILGKIRGTAFKAIACPSSSFPSSVASYGKNKGSFPILEIRITEELQKEFGIFHGDFGSVHPIRYEARWGGWVPRIDFPSGKDFHYYRYRREDGGYSKAASKVRADTHYAPVSKFEVWGDTQIRAAATGAPVGLSPSFWIAARINLYITQQHLRLAGSPKLSL